MLGSGKYGRSLVVLLVCGTRGCRVGVGGRATFTMRMRGIIAAGGATLDHTCKFCRYTFRKLELGWQIVKDGALYEVWEVWACLSPHSKS